MPFITWGMSMREKKEYAKTEKSYNQAYKYAKIKQAKNRSKSMKKKG